MKPLRASLIAFAIAAFAGAAMASSGSLVNFKPNVMPVVVQVNAQGRVTDILPSLQLAPWERQMLLKQLDAWIVKPAVVKGHPVASRFIIEVAMQTKPRKDGKYDAGFVYVRSLPLAYGGALHWNVINGGLELALVADAGSSHFARQVFDTTNYWQGTDRSAHASQSAAGRAVVPQPASNAVYQSVPMPTIVSPPQASPAAARSGSAPHTEIP